MAGAKRVGGLILVWLALSAGAALLLGFLDSNILWGEPNQYGRVDMPGSKVLHLPAGETDARVAAILPGRGNETPDLPLPSELSMTVTPVSGDGHVTVVRSFGYTENANDKYADTQRRAFKVTVPKEGDYRVSIPDGIGFFAVDTAMWFGHGPPVPAGFVWLLGGAVAAVGLFAFPRLRPKRKQAATDWAPARRAGFSSRPNQLATLHRTGQITDEELQRAKQQGDSVAELFQLAKLHKEGVVNDADFAEGKRRILKQT